MLRSAPLEMTLIVVILNLLWSQNLLQFVLKLLFLKLLLLNELQQCLLALVPRCNFEIRAICPTIVDVDIDGDLNLLEYLNVLSFYLGWG